MTEEKNIKKNNLSEGYQPSSNSIVPDFIKGFKPDQNTIDLSKFQNLQSGLVASNQNNNSNSNTQNSKDKK